MTKIKTSELEGAALDYAVAVAEGNAPEPWLFKPSTDWAQGGPIIEREKIDLAHYEPTDEWQARGYVQHFYHQGYSPTPLIAAMRCYVASKLGDEVDIPDELI